MNEREWGENVRTLVDERDALTLERDEWKAQAALDRDRYTARANQLGDVERQRNALQARVAELERLLNNATHLAQDEGDAREAHQERADALEKRVKELEEMKLDWAPGEPTYSMWTNDTLDQLEYWKRKAHNRKALTRVLNRGLSRLRQERNDAVDGRTIFESHLVTLGTRLDAAIAVLKRVLDTSEVCPICEQPLVCERNCALAACLKGEQP